MVRRKLKGGNPFNQTLGPDDSGGGALDQANQNQITNAAQVSEMNGQGGGGYETSVMPAPSMGKGGANILQDSANTSQQLDADSQFDGDVGKPTSCQKGLSGIFGGRKRKKTFRKKRKRKKRRTKKRKRRRRSKRKGKKKKGGRTRRRKMKKPRFSRMPPLKV